MNDRRQIFGLIEMSVTEHILGFRSRYLCGFTQGEKKLYVYMSAAI
jgi:hypothetical protein